MAVTLLGSISLISSSSPIAPNFLLPHFRRIQTPRVCMRTQCTVQQQQQHNENKFKIVVVNRAHKETSLLSITESGEGIDDIISIPNLDALPIASCHGLFLTTRRLGIWNPKDDDDVIRTIPQSSVPRPPNIVHETNLMYGFGFDPSSNDYKVIRFVDFQCDDDGGVDNFYMCNWVDNFYLCNWVVELFSLKSQSWKRIAYPHGAGTAYLADSAGVCINGFCYWKMSVGSTGPFDLANDTFPCALIPGPDGFFGFKFHLVEFEGSLIVVAYQDQPFEFELWVWNHNYDESSWSKRGAWAINGGDVNFYFPLKFFFKNDQIFLQNSTHELVLFDFAKQKLKNLGFYAAHDNYLRIFPYVES